MKKLLCVIALVMMLPMPSKASTGMLFAYRETEVPLKSIAHFLQNDTVVSVVGRKGEQENRVTRNESFRAMEIRKKVRVAELNQPIGSTSSVRYLLGKENAEVVWEDDSRGSAVKLRPQVTTFKFDSTGRHQEEMELRSLPYLSLPVIFPAEPIDEGHIWSETQEILVEGSLPMKIRTDYRFTRMLTLAGQKVAEIRYEIQGALKSTEVTDNPGLLRAIEQLRSRGFERIELSGTGRMTFNVSKGTPMVHVVDLTVSTMQRSLTLVRSEVTERITELHKAEAMLLQ